MHFRFQALLGILLVLGFCFSGGGCASGQPTQTSDAQSQLVKAFVLVQQADMAGASPEQITELGVNLNLSLPYTNESASMSAATSCQGLTLSNAAPDQLPLRQAVVYSTAFR